MFPRTRFLKLATSIVETSFPNELDFFHLEADGLIDRLERGGREEGGELENQEFGVGDVYESLKFLTVLVATYKTILDVRDRRKKKGTRAPSTVTDVEVRRVFREHLANEHVDPATAQRVERAHAADIEQLTLE